MKLFVVRGAREYFYPHAATSMEGLPVSAAPSNGALISPSLSWLRPAPALEPEAAPVAAPYHSTLLQELEAQFRLDLVLDYLGDSVSAEGAAVLMFPEQRLAVCGVCPPPLSRIVERARERLGASYVWSGWVSLGGTFDGVVLRGAHGPAVDDDSHLTPLPESPLYSAMHRNWSFNVLAGALADAFARLDNVLSVGQRHESLARELDTLGARVLPGTTRGQLDTYCDRLVRRQLGYDGEVTRDA